MIDGLEAAEDGRDVVAAYVDVGSLVSHGIAIVRSREDGDTLAVVHHFVALLLDLVAPHHVLELVARQESLGDVRSELYADAALALRAAARILRIGPHQVAHEAVLGRLSIAIDGAYVVQRDIVAAEQAAVHAYDLAVDDVTQRQAVEYLGEEAEHLRRVLGLDLALEAVHLIHVDALVVAARQEEVSRIGELEREQREYDLDAERAAVDKVAVEKLLYKQTNNFNK